MAAERFEVTEASLFETYFQFSFRTHTHSHMYIYQLIESERNAAAIFQLLCYWLFQGPIRMI
jgi:hypothetical protein